MSTLSTIDDLMSSYFRSGSFVVNFLLKILFNRDSVREVPNFGYCPVTAHTVQKLYKSHLHFYGVTNLFIESIFQQLYLQLFMRDNESQLKNNYEGYRDFSLLSIQLNFVLFFESEINLFYKKQTKYMFFQGLFLKKLFFTNNNKSINSNLSDFIFNFNSSVLISVIKRRKYIK